LALPVILTVITELRGHCGYDCMVIKLFGRLNVFAPFLIIIILILILILLLLLLLLLLSFRGP
jgi:hypothetical protein